MKGIKGPAHIFQTQVFLFLFIIIVHIIGVHCPLVLGPITKHGKVFIKRSRPQSAF